MPGGRARTRSLNRWRRKEAMPRDATQLAVDRTRLAYERTLMGWVRTAASLISFGFAIDKFFEHVPNHEPHRWLNTQHISLVMMWIAIVSLGLATWQHHRDLKDLQRDFGKQPFSPALIIAALVAGLGVLGLLAILTQGQSPSWSGSSQNKKSLSRRTASTRGVVGQVLFASSSHPP